jgi:chemotaxis protein MotA
MGNWGKRTFTGGDLDRSMLHGFLLSAGLVLVGALVSGQFLQFFDAASIVLVLGGTFGATLVQFSFREIKAAWNLTKRVSRSAPIHPSHRVRDLMTLSQRVKQGGILILEDEAQRVRDRFFRTGLEIAADGQNELDIKRILETEVLTTTERDSRAVEVVQAMGSYAPALGLIGTLLGLVKLLGGLNDPATVGPAMSIALLTTLYGSLLANLVFIPVAGKLKAYADEQALIKTLTIEGILSISRIESPLILEQRLRQFMPGFRSAA